MASSTINFDVTKLPITTIYDFPKEPYPTRLRIAAIHRVPNLSSS